MKEMLPREKAIKFGISALSDKELLCLIIKTGYRNKSVFDLSEELLVKTGGIENICALDYEELLGIKGFGEVKALSFLAVIEMFKRATTITKVSDNVINTPAELVNWIKFNIAFSQTEEFFVLYLNTRGQVIKNEILFKGTKSSSIVGIDEIARRAILLHANSIVIAHNHPSGNCEPSPADIKLTDKLAKGLFLIDIKLLDHIIVTRNSYFSFKERALLA